MFHRRQICLDQTMLPTCQTLQRILRPGHGLKTQCQLKRRRTERCLHRAENTALRLRPRPVLRATQEYAINATSYNAIKGQYTISNTYRRQHPVNHDHQTRLFQNTSRDEYRSVPLQTRFPTRRNGDRQRLPFYRQRHGCKCPFM